MKKQSSAKRKKTKAKAEAAKPKGLAALIGCVVTALLLGLTVRSFGFTLVVVRSEGMAGTLLPGDVVLVVRSAQPERGRVVLAGASNGSVFRRVIGEPGDTVEFRGGDAWVNGFPLHEPYRSETAMEDPPAAELEAGVYLLAPDDRSMPCALVERGGIAGGAVAVVWPLSRAGFL